MYTGEAQFQGFVYVFGRMFKKPNSSNTHTEHSTNIKLFCGHNCISSGNHGSPDGSSNFELVLPFKPNQSHIHLPSTVEHSRDLSITTVYRQHVNGMGISSNRGKPNAKYFNAVFQVVD